MFEDHRKFHLKLENPKVITQGSLATKDTVSIWYLIYKLCFGAYFLCSFGLYLYVHGHLYNDIGLSMIYLTHWGHKLMVISFIFNTTLVVIRFIQENRTVTTGDHFFERNSFLIGLSWVMSLTAYNCAIVVTIVYWVALADLEKDASTMLDEFKNYDVHLMQTVITSLDVVASARPWRFCHVIYPLIYALTYTGFNVVYTIGFGGKNYEGEAYIYSILDWSNAPTTAIIWVVGSLSLVIISQILLCVLSYTRDKVFEHFMKKYRKDVVIENVGMENMAYDPDNHV